MLATLCYYLKLLLKVSMWVYIVGAGIQRLAPLSRLASLRLQGCTEVLGQTLTVLGALTHLDLSHVPAPFQDANSEALGRLTTLQSLRAVGAFCLLQQGGAHAHETPSKFPAQCNTAQKGSSACSCGLSGDGRS